MKITHYMSRFRLADGGVVRAVLDICAVLAGRGHEVRILTWDDSDIPDEWKSEGGAASLPRILRLRPPSRIAARFRGRDFDTIRSTLADSDVLHLHTPWERSNVQVAKLARAANVPYILTVHGMLDDWSMEQRGAKKRMYLKIAGRDLLENAASVHCTAEGELDQAKKWFPRGHGCVAPYVFDLTPYRELPGPDIARQAIPSAGTDDPIILFLSRLHYKKQPEVLIDAATILRDEGRTFRVLFAGTGELQYEHELRSRVREQQLEAVVYFLGLVIGQQKVSLYQRAEVFALPTSQENFGFVLTESLACATPVVSTRGTDIWREIEACGGAIIAEGSPQATAHAIAELLDDPSRAKQMGECGRKWVFDALDPPVIAARFEEIYSRAMNSEL